MTLEKIDIINMLVTLVLNYALNLIVKDRVIKRSRSNSQKLNVRI